MTVVLTKPRRAATGAELARILQALDHDASAGRKVSSPRQGGLGARYRMMPGGADEKPSLRPRYSALTLEDGRDDTGALRAGHQVSWGALWGEDEAPVYDEARANPAVSQKA